MNADERRFVITETTSTDHILSIRAYPRHPRDPCSRRLFHHQHPPHNRLNQPLAVRLRVQESGFKLIAEGHELGNPGDDA